ncbi:unnamed protein product [Prorocentrum cordatum]|uniref:Ubiquitin-like domain-containing protein n=1 Tax=Prorocentrum cordatum TaxID=2364126 RepID=A0ABN9TEV7_9DINO|nr:unnamed protein product [Polarella glacialis]
MADLPLASAPSSTDPLDEDEMGDVFASLAEILEASGDEPHQRDQQPPVLVRLHTLDGRSLEATLPRDAAVADIKRKVQSLHGVPEFKQRLVLGVGALADDERPLLACQRRRKNGMNRNCRSSARIS